MLIWEVWEILRDVRWSVKYCGARPFTDLWTRRKNLYSVRNRSGADKELRFCAEMSWSLLRLWQLHSALEGVVEVCLFFGRLWTNPLEWSNITDQLLFYFTKLEKLREQPSQDFALLTDDVTKMCSVLQFVLFLCRTLFTKGSSPRLTQQSDCSGKFSTSSLWKRRSSSYVSVLVASSICIPVVLWTFSPPVIDLRLLLFVKKQSDNKSTYLYH